MFKIPIAELKEKIIASGNIDSLALEEKIKAKINELSGLISEEGAAHIIANELGIVFEDPKGKVLKIKEIYSGMKNVTLTGKVVRVYEMREFSKNDRSGKVQSLMIGDETGSMRAVFWNDQVDGLTSVAEDTIIKIVDGYVRDNDGRKEIHLGSRGSIEINPEGVEVNSVRRGNEYSRKEIHALQPEDTNAEIVGTIVQVFDPRFFEVHPETGKRIQPGENVTPALSYVMNAVIDDGTGNIRVVFWKNQVHHLASKSADEMAAYKENPAQFEDVKTDLLGEQYRLHGRVQRNDMFDRLEFVAQIVEKADPEKELANKE